MQIADVRESPLSEIPRHGVTYMHWKGIIHRDLKPSNLLLASDVRALVIADLGGLGATGLLHESLRIPTISAYVYI